MRGNSDAPHRATQPDTTRAGCSKKAVHQGHSERCENATGGLFQHPAKELITVTQVSVIIPAYNGTTRYLEQAIHSVLAQTYVDQEVIVVDDASTDDTRGLVRKISHVRYQRRSHNGGQAAARNTGAQLAQDPIWHFSARTICGNPRFWKRRRVTDLVTGAAGF
ncbi:MAG: glycosyltransferase [Nitrospira sp.]|nr:glycosyltransferase [Nitrospira sp.]